MKIFNEDKRDSYAKTYYAFLRLSHQVEARIKGALKPYDLTHAQLNVLYHLGRLSPEKINPGELKKLLLVNNPDLTRLIDRLARKNWVSRNISSENKRKVEIAITGKGKRILEKAHYAAKESVNDFFKQDIDDNESVQLYNLLNKIDLSQS